MPVPPYPPDDLISRLLVQIAVADEPLTHPSLEDVPDSMVRERVKWMLAERLVTGELFTACNGRWIVEPGLRITRSGRAYLWGNRRGS